MHRETRSSEEDCFYSAIVLVAKKNRKLRIYTFATAQIDLV